MAQYLMTMAEAAKSLGISEATLRGHVQDGEITFVAFGRGLKKVRRMFAQSDLDTFVERRRRKAKCPSTSQKTRRTTTMISSGPVVDFTALRAARRAAKPKPLND